MNLADYLSELLGQYDEVSVPGLGYFVRTRINAAFNESEARFYPPYHQVRFVPQPKDDDTFAQYVADKKNISLASSKYFVEKFISKLREDASRGKFLFSDLGSFQTEQDQLVFKPNDRIPADPAFYGYPPVDIYRQGQPVSTDQRKPVFTPNQPTTTTTPPPVVETAPPVATIRPPQYYEEEVEPKRGVNVWLIVLIVISVLALAAFGVYKFYPSAFDKIKEKYEQLTGKKTADTPIVHKTIKADTVKKAVPVKDTTAKDTTVKAAATATQPVDTVKHSTWEIMVGAYATKQRADDAIKYYHNRGVELKVLNATDAPGVLIKLSAGTYPTNAEAESARLQLVKEHKLRANTYSLEIKPQK